MVSPLILPLLIQFWSFKCWICQFWNVVLLWWQSLYALRDRVFMYLKFSLSCLILPLRRQGWMHWFLGVVRKRPRCQALPAWAAALWRWPWGPQWTAHPGAASSICSCMGARAQLGGHQLEVILLCLTPNAECWA